MKSSSFFMSATVFTLVSLVAAAFPLSLPMLSAWTASLVVLAVATLVALA